ncbi:MAG: hypothetical protein K2G70_01230, partial [Turicibacter sp.]|nr:hypothetical protein [Turicibacter sp.]
VWTKIYVKEHKDILRKEIVSVFSSRKEANIGEVELLKSVESDPLCINKYFDYTPDVSGTKQTPEWIEKRKLFGEKNGMFGKHHTEEAKKQISEKLKGRIVSKEARKKIGDFHRGKVYGDETRQKISKTRSKTRHIENIITGESWDISITDFIKLHPDENLNANTMRKAAQEHHIYKKTYRITECAAFTSNSDCKPDKIGESPEVDNPDGSVGSE